VDRIALFGTSLAPPHPDRVDQRRGMAAPHGGQRRRGVPRHAGDRTDYEAPGSGAMVCFTSGLVGLGWPGAAAYAASKGALLGLAKCAAAELRPYRVRVNVSSRHRSSSAWRAARRWRCTSARSGFRSPMRCAERALSDLGGLLQSDRSGARAAAGAWQMSLAPRRRTECSLACRSCVRCACLAIGPL
jgi:NAD(P)-dependent dehydrogenase (short-subunit alcohol dehydrogenase family)